MGNALRKVTQQFPAPSDLSETLDNLHEQDDRAVAVVGASILEAILERFIERKLANCTPELASKLFRNRGPMSDFHGKIIVAEASGFITPTMANDLSVIRTVRNAFAHSVVGINFETKEIADELRKTKVDEFLRELRAVKNAPLTPAMWFTLQVRLLIIVLDVNHTSEGGTSFTKDAPADISDLSRDVVG